jgi:(S)-3,5-dihydroxyphenylglycine transaminase
VPKAETAKYQSRVVELKNCFSDPMLDVMNFLNEIIMQYPAAISFAPGRPMEAHFGVEESVSGIAGFVAATAEGRGISQLQVWNELGQYSRTNGTINELIAKQLANDEGIHVSPRDIMVTVGAQEAMAVVLAGIFESGKDVLLTSDPTYVGITGLAKIFGIPSVPIPAGEDGLEPERVEQAIRQCSEWGRPRALYDIPDFNNPLGTSMPVERRRRLLDVCSRNGVLIIEDNPYGMFVYEGEHSPTLKALDSDQTVLYIGSFAKTLFPAMRLGYVVADQEINGKRLAEELSKVKSLLTVNTSPLLQAMAAQTLFKHQLTLRPLMELKIKDYRRNRDVMCDCLASEFADLTAFVKWNRPRGGFFLTLQLPFDFGEQELQRCAANYGVIVSPMKFFTMAGKRQSQVRLSFSYVSEDLIREGIRRLRLFVMDTLGKPSHQDA